MEEYNFFENILMLKEKIFLPALKYAAKLVSVRRNKKMEVWEKDR